LSAYFKLHQEGILMKKAVRALSFSLALAALPAAASFAIDTTTNPAMEKFQQDMKTAVLNGSITVPQVKELQTNAETLKAARAAQAPGAPIDLLTPYRAVSNMKTIMASVDAKDRDILHEDLQAVLANQQPKSPSADPPTPGQKLGKDVFKAVMFGKPTEPQVQQLQESLNSLEKVKSGGEGPLQKLRALKTSKSQIEEVMNAGEFRPADRQAVLDDLNNLGPQGGGGLRR
jgi:hypothetical protein